MAHNLNFQNGQAAYFGTQPAWHGLGTQVDKAQTSEEAMKLALLDYEVGKKIIQTTDGIQIPDYFATVRMDNSQPLGVVGNRYEILQNKDAFRFIDEIVGSKQAIFESAGALGQGERIWLSCKLPETLVIGNNDAADNYLFLTNSHDGSKTVEMAFTNVFICCNNTLREALRTGKRKQSVRHTTNMFGNLHRAADLMGITRERMEAQKEMFETMRKVQINDKQLRAFIEAALKPEKETMSSEEYSTRFTNNVEAVLEYGLTDSAQLINERRGNLWGAYNAITGYYNNVETTKDKLNSIMYGNGFRKSQKALDVALGVMNNQLILS